MWQSVCGSLPVVYIRRACLATLLRSNVSNPAPTDALHIGCRPHHLAGSKGQSAPRTKKYLVRNLMGAYCDMYVAVSRVEHARVRYKLAGNRATNAAHGVTFMYVSRVMLCRAGQSPAHVKHQTVRRAPTPLHPHSFLHASIKFGRSRKFVGGTQIRYALPLLCWPDSKQTSSRAEATAQDEKNKARFSLLEGAVSLYLCIRLLRRMPRATDPAEARANGVSTTVTSYLPARNQRHRRSTRSRRDREHANKSCL